MWNPLANRRDGIPWDRGARLEFGWIPQTPVLLEVFPAVLNQIFFFLGFFSAFKSEQPQISAPSSLLMSLTVPGLSVLLKDIPRQQQVTRESN